jgi:predicted enzyme related to lactoylglutathione lyase
MITAVHTLIFSDDPETTRAFLRDVLEWDHVDAGGGWLIFKTGPSEMGVHPSSGEHEGKTYKYPMQHQITLMCDDIEKTMAELTAKGATFTSDVVNQGYGLVAKMAVPAAGEIDVYQPLHPEAFKL